MSTWSTRFGAVSYLGRKPILEWVAITAAIAITRVIFRSRYLYDIDSVNYALAVARFDPSVHQPHPPGYFLYVWLARIANLWMQNPNDALVAISVTTSCLAVVAILLLAENWFGATAARFAGLAFLFSPLGWFHGTVALSYIVEACFSAWIGYFCWRAYRGSDNLICVAALLLGLATGVRQSSILFLGPLFLICLMKCRRKMQIAGAAVLLLTLAGWLVPMTLAAGGISAYLSALWALWKIAPAQATLFNSSPLMSFARLLTVLFIGVLSLGALLIPAGIGLRNPRGSRDVQLARLQARFTWLWALPAFLFFTLIFLRFVNSGYMLILLPVACIWLGDALARCYQAQSTNKASLLLGLCAAANVLVFLAAPVYSSYRSVRAFENDLEEVRATLPQIASSQDTLIVGFDSHFLGYRHAGYYLPEYQTLQYPEVQLGDGKRVFAMHDKDTWLASVVPGTKVPSQNYTQFVLFPLPLDEKSYAEYAAKVMSRFPSSHLRVIAKGRHQYVVGPISDLALLFPATFRPSTSGAEDPVTVSQRSIAGFNSTSAVNGR